MKDNFDWVLVSYFISFVKIFVIYVLSTNVGEFSVLLENNIILKHVDLTEALMVSQSSDIDECESDSPCRGENEVCVNTRGGYKCNAIECPDTYTRDAQHKK